MTFDPEDSWLDLVSQRSENTKPQMINALIFSTCIVILTIHWHFPIIEIQKTDTRMNKCVQHQRRDSFKCKSYLLKWSNIWNLYYVYGSYTDCLIIVDRVLGLCRRPGFPAVWSWLSRRRQRAGTSWRSLGASGHQPVLPEFAYLEWVGPPTASVFQHCSSGANQQAGLLSVFPASSSLPRGKTHTR